MDEGYAAFCAACGLPQLEVPEEFLPEAPAAAGEARPGDRPAALDWPLSLRIAAVGALAGSVFAGMLPGALLFGAAGLFAVLLMPLLMLACGTAYVRRRPFHDFSAAAGARLGSALGLFMAVALTLGTGLAGFAARYGYHSHALEDVLTASVAQAMARTVAQGTGVPPGWETWAASPEMRAGLFLLMELLLAVLLLAAGAVSGAVTGMLLHARQKRHRRET